MKPKASSTGTARVVLAGPLPPWRSGIADQTVRLAVAMTRIGVVPTVLDFVRMYPRFLYPGKTDRDPAPKGAAPPPFPVLPLLDGTNPLSFREAARRAAAIDPDLVVVPWWTSFFAPHVRGFLDVLAKRSPRTVRLLLCHNTFDHEGGGLGRRVAASVFRRCDRLAVQNQAALAETSRLAPAVKVGLLPHPVEPRHVLPDREEARSRLGVPPGAALFLFTGLLREYKGWDLLLEAFARVHREYPHALLVLAGEPWGEAKKLLRRPPPPGVRIEPRWLSEAERALWLDACDAVVCPYRHATGSGVAADALAHGRGLIGTRVDGLLEVVRDGDSGLLVPPGDAGALEEALLRFLREGLGPRLAAGAALHRPRFSPEEHARRLLALGGIPG